MTAFATTNRAASDVPICVNLDRISPKFDSLHESSLIGRVKDALHFRLPLKFTRDLVLYGLGTPSIAIQKIAGRLVFRMGIDWPTPH